MVDLNPTPSLITFQLSLNIPIKSLEIVTMTEKRKTGADAVYKKCILKSQATVRFKVKEDRCPQHTSCSYGSWVAYLQPEDSPEVGRMFHNHNRMSLITEL